MEKIMAGLLPLTISAVGASAVNPSHDDSTTQLVESMHVDTDDTTSHPESSLLNEAHLSNEAKNYIQNTLISLDLEGAELREVSSSDNLTHLHVRGTGYNMNTASTTFDPQRTYCSPAAGAFMAEQLSISPQEIAIGIQKIGAGWETFSSQVYGSIIDQQDLIVNLSSGQKVEFKGEIVADWSDEIADEEHILQVFQDLAIGKTKIFFVQNIPYGKSETAHIGHTFTVARVSETEFVLSQTVPAWYVPRNGAGINGMFFSIGNVTGMVEMMELMRVANGANVLFTAEVTISGIASQPTPEPTSQGQW